MVGERALGLFFYATGTERAEALAALSRTCAPAVGDDVWIVWANTNESATAVHNRLGGNLSLVQASC
jgi:hypothetical protein